MCCMKKRIWKERATHWMTWTKFYKVWTGIKKRCNNKKWHDYKYYWWRGIMYNKKRENFENFKDDMYKLYVKHLEEHWKKQTTIDRIDVNWNYCKENCRRATREVQNNNQRNSTKIIYNNKTQTRKMWSKELWIPIRTIYYRINNWLSIQNILNTKYKRKLANANK